MNEHMVTADPPTHTRERALLMRLITSRRLNDNKAFMYHLSDQLVDEFIGDGHCEFIGAYSQPFAMLVVADLLGVPASDHERFREGFGSGPRAGQDRLRFTHRRPPQPAGLARRLVLQVTSRTVAERRGRMSSPTLRWRRTPTNPCPK